MDLLKRIQRWYTINCNGDWEHEYTVSITNIDNPGWWVIIDLEGTCLAKAILPKDSSPIVRRSSTDWTMWYVEDKQFIASGGPENLSELLSYFLDVFLPANIDPDCTFELLLPISGYEDKLWLEAEARMLSESVLKIVAIADGQQVQSYSCNSDAEFMLLDELAKADLLTSLRAHYMIGDLVEPHTYQPDGNQLTTSLVAPFIR